MKFTRAKEWLFRGSLIVIGLALVLVSFTGLSRGIYWVPWFNSRMGEQAIMPLPFMFLFGVLLTIIGIFARDSKESAKRHRR